MLSSANSSGGMPPVPPRAQALQLQLRALPTHSRVTPRISTNLVVHFVSSMRYGFPRLTSTNPILRTSMILAPGILIAIAMIKQSVRPSLLNSMTLFLFAFTSTLRGPPSSPTRYVFPRDFLDKIHQITKQYVHFGAYTVAHLPSLNLTLPHSISQYHI